MLNNDEALLTPHSRMSGTISGLEDVRGGKLAHYSSLAIFQSKIFKFGEIAQKVNEVLRYTDYDKLETIPIFQQITHDQFMESMLQLYSL